MADVSKNARGVTAAQKFMCSCGGAVKMKNVFTKGKLRIVAHCDKCDRVERKPSHFRN